MSLLQLANNFNGMLNIGTVSCKHSPWICNLQEITTDSFRFYQKNILQTRKFASDFIEISQEKSSDELLELVLRLVSTAKFTVSDWSIILETLQSPIAIWSGPEYWQNVQKGPSVVFFDFNDFYTDNIQTRKTKMLLEEKNPKCQIGILKCMDSVAANRFCEQMFITEAKIVVFKGLKGHGFEITSCAFKMTLQI